MCHAYKLSGLVRQRLTEADRGPTEVRQLSTDRVPTEPRQSPDRAPTEPDRARQTDSQGSIGVWVTWCSDDALVSAGVWVTWRWAGCMVPTASFGGRVEENISWGEAQRGQLEMLRVSRLSWRAPQPLLARRIYQYLIARGHRLLCDVRHPAIASAGWVTGDTGCALCDAGCAAGPRPGALVGGSYLLT